MKLFLMKRDGDWVQVQSDKVLIDLEKSSINIEEVNGYIKVETNGK